MSVTLNPYLNFRGNAREAMEFYQKVFGGALNISTFADLHTSSDPSEDALVMHSELKAPNDLILMAADAPGHVDYRPGTNFSVSLSGDDEVTLGRYWEKLAEGGVISMPLEKAAWGDTFGMCTDKFGISWLVNVAAGVGAAAG